MIRISDNLEVNKPAPIDDRLGVFSSTASALAYIPEDRRYIGLTVIVDTGSGATEYWFENGVENADLVAKSTGGGGGFNCADLLTCTDFTDLQNDVASIQANAVFDGDTAGGDLQSTYPNPIVHRIHGIDFQSGNPSAGDVWIYGGSPNKWQHQPLTNNEIPTGIDATKIANGNVSNAEFQTLDGVTSSIQSQLNSKVDANGAITGSTRTKITYDSKGLVTSGADLTFADLPTTSPIGYTSPLASILSGGVVTETQLTTVTIPAGAFKSGDNILLTIWGTRTTGAATGVNSTISLKITNTGGAQMMTNQTGNRHQNFTITGKALSDTSIIWWGNSATTAANTTTVPSLLNNGFTISIGLIRTNTTDEFTLYNCIVRKYS